MTKEQTFLLSILDMALFGHVPAVPKELDWSAVLRESMAHSVLPLTLSAARPWIPEEQRRSIRVTEARTIAGSMRLEQEHAELHACLSGAGIPYAVIKGSASAAYYPEPLLRTVGDVDFLIDRADRERTTAALRSIAFIPPKTENRYHAEFRRNGGQKSNWEMHWEINGIPDGTCGDKIRREFARLVDQASLREGMFGPYMVPSPFHHGLVLLLHTANHMLNTGVGLRHICDWAVFVGGMDEASLRAMYEPFLRETGLWNFLLILTALCTRYLGAGHAWTLEYVEKELLERLMEDVFRSGNFGVKDRQRINQAKLLTTKSSATVDNAGLLRQLARSMNEKARMNLPACRKCPLLLPVGWLIAGVKHLARIIRRKRPPIHVRETLSGARERKKIYRQFHLFEEE